MFILKSNFIDKEAQMQKGLTVFQEKVLQLEKLNQQLLS